MPKRPAEAATLPPGEIAERVISELVEWALVHEGRELLQFQSQVAAHQYLLLYRLFGRYVPPGSEVLDWGTGSGHFSYFLVRSGYHTSGFSLDPFEFVGRVPDRQYRFILGDPSQPVLLPFSDSSFDAVSSIGVLEHVRETGGDELASLREIKRILKPGGHFVCYHLPNRYSLIEAAARRVPGKYRHLYRFTRGDVRRLASAAGLELLETQRYGFLPRNFWNSLPTGLRRARFPTRLWDWADRVLSSIFGPFCQNHLFVAQKRAAR